MSVPISCRGEHLVEARALDIEDFSAQRQHRLEGAVAPLLRRAAGRIALDEKKLASSPDRVSWQSASLPGSEAMSSAPLRHGSSRALRAASRACAARTTFSTTFFASAGCSSSQLFSASLTSVLDDRPHLGGDELVLRLRGEFRIRHLDRDDRRQPLAAIVADERDLLPLRETGDSRHSR